jgi:hypothetical protein
MTKSGPSGGARRAKALRFPTFNPEPSARAGVKVLRAAGVEFAVIGRVAVWMYVPPERQAYTKDVDFAVPHSAFPRVIEAAREEGYSLNPLPIGGWALRAKGIAVDFIDRHPELGALFAAAIRAARETGCRARVGRLSVPVVPIDFLIAMKVATGEPKDESDVEALVQAVPDAAYAPLRALVRKYLGPAGALRLDVIARRVGHPGPGRRPY